MDGMEGRPVADDPYAGDKPDCDLVMKGGITSGVVYPSAVLALARRYRFKNVGGASAGAIAAAATAAAEYSRRRGDTGGMRALRQVTEELGRPGFLIGLFQPTPAARPLFEALTQSSKPGRSKLGTAVAAQIRIYRAQPLPALAVTLAWVAMVVLTVAAFSSLPTGLATVLTVLALPLATVGLKLLGLGASTGLLVRRLLSSLPASGYGMCPGTRQPRQSQPALGEWLHEKVQACAGRTPDEPPVTFADLEEAGVRLEVLTTDLSYSHPVRLPLTADNVYYFRPEDLEGVVPEPIVRHMLESREASEGPGGTRRVPGHDMPILLASRLSLSFPMLLSAVRLSSPNPKRPGELIENWLSDGGISSNFPIHFFDSWFPGHPTFGLDLQPYPDEAWEPGAPDVYLPSGPDDSPSPHWTRVRNVGNFLRQVKDAAESWRDTMQSELPGFRDRVCQVRLKKGEGGLNLNMDKAVIDKLVGKGEHAGETICTGFDWTQHRFIRYLTFMQMMEEGLHDADDRFADFAPLLAEGVPGVKAYREGHDPAWCRAAGGQTERLFSVGGGWGPDPAEIGFDRGNEPRPTPVMRVTPRT